MTLPLSQKVGDVVVVLPSHVLLFFMGNRTMMLLFPSHSRTSYATAWTVQKFRRESPLQDEGLDLVFPVSAWLSQAKTRPEARPACTYSGAAQTAVLSFVASRG